ncbi:YHS domain-containing (seleno)protein [Vibrio sp. S9_S30]|uniref:YHS domain-containing (seleno)protein n=1 Tax=Vibrio sp. S9_S30 TaxID=2720226 RepID=UPI00406C40A9
MTVLCTLVLGMFSAMTYAADPIYTGFFSNKAISGYDAVSYFEASEPQKGSSNHIIEYQGADWYFASKENLEKFIQNPEKYAPQYGGYCAWAIAFKNDTAPSDPLQWTIVDGKLYLNYDADIKSRWEKDIPGFIREGDKNWSTLVSK